MGTNGKKHKWKISIHTRNKSTHQPEPPREFFCSISGSLMSDPVVVSSGHTFDRVSVQVCRDLNFTPLLHDDDNSVAVDFTTVIPNLALKAAILNWCHSSATPPPSSPDYLSVEKIVRARMPVSDRRYGQEIGVSERELLDGVAQNSPVIFSHAVTELAHRVNHFNSASSDDFASADTAASAAVTPLPLATRPACFSSFSSNSSFEIVETETQGTLRQDTDSSPPIPEEEEIVAKLKKTEVHEQEGGVILLRKLTRTREETRLALCSTRLLLALRFAISSRYFVVQTNAIASVVNLSLEKSNKVKIVRSGYVPPLVDVLKAGSGEAQEHAAGALFSLALDDENKMAIGVLGAFQPLLHALRSESERTCLDSAMALYHLSLMQGNRVKLLKLGAVSMLLSMVKVRESSIVSRILLVLCNLAACKEGRHAMLDANAVAILVGMLKDRSEVVDSNTIQENCIAVLYALSHGSLRFIGMAKEAQAVEVLRKVEERGSKRGKEKAKRILEMMRGSEEEDEVSGSGGLGLLHYRIGIGGRDSGGPNSTNF